MHQKHSNIIKATFGNFARNEIAVMGTPCTEIKILFEKIIGHLPNKNIAIIEADHKAEESLTPFTNYIDKINFQRFDSNYKRNSFEIRTLFENTDLVLVNGNHFEAEAQIVIIDNRKALEKKLAKLTNVQLIILAEPEMPAYLLQFFADKMPPILRMEQEFEIFKFIENLIESAIAPMYGLVLAGGKSTRMGSDKASLQYHGKQNQSAFAFELLNQFCEKTFLSLNESQAKNTDNKMPFIVDTFLGIGPMGGILSAFQNYPNVAWLTVACDMPFLSEKSLNQLKSNRNSSKLATTFKSPFDQFPEPLATIWEPKAFPKLLQMLAYGYDCPRKTLINSDIELLINEQNSELQNINTLLEYEKAIIDLSPKLC